MAQDNNGAPSQDKPEMHNVRHLSGMYENWFLEYASYVILERAVPHLHDGLKPVQRRILHSMRRLDDGRYNKVANIIGHTMQFHPHGDASIGEALVQLGQKDLLIDTQGNWGNIHTGDSAAAPRYIEARLSKFALEVVFNPKTTEWKLSYDGRNKEPVNLPVKFPLLLAQGVEGIAVGLASKILPHNFLELVDAAVAYLQGKPFELLPDFPTGGMADVSRYNDGIRGGKVRVRARIEKVDNKTLAIRELPFGKTTTAVIDSIIAANEKGKIKIKKIDDNTAEHVEILVHLAGVSPDITIDALYAFTECEVSISPNSCIIEDDKPRFVGVAEMLRTSADHTLELLRAELNIRMAELHEAWHFSSLEKVFIENRIYILIEKCETWEEIIQTIDKGLEPFKPMFRRTITEEDITRLTEIKIKRISRYDAFKADERIRGIEQEMKEVQHHLDNIVRYTIDYYLRVREKFGKGRERRTELRNFETIEATDVVANNEKLYINRAEGFIGTGLKKDEFLFDCSDIDDIIFFRRDGTYQVSKVADKLFVGKNLIHVGIFKKADERTIYNAIYFDGESGHTLAKRFAVPAMTRDKEYNLATAHPSSKVLYFTANPNGEAELVKVILRPKARLRKLVMDFDFSELGIKGRNSKGNVVTRNAVHRVVLKEEGVSTLGGRKIWFDPTILRLNDDGRGQFLGEFKGADRIVVVNQKGWFRTTGFELTNHFEPELLLIEKFDPEKVFAAVFWEGEQKFHYLKRFTLEESEKQSPLLGEHPESKFLHLFPSAQARIQIFFGGPDKNREPEWVDVEEFIAVKSCRARGKRLTTFNVKRIEPFLPEPTDEPQEHEPDPGEGLKPGSQVLWNFDE